MTKAKKSEDEVIVSDWDNVRMEVGRKLGESWEKSWGKILELILRDQYISASAMADAIEVSARAVEKQLKKSRVVFVSSMSDLFHEEIPVSYIQRVFQVMNNNPRHVFQVLTKRADILYQYDLDGLLKWTHNIWMGVTLVNPDYAASLNRC